MVHLVGAGPGDPGLVTARGLELLARADLVLYDHLAPRSLLLRARPGARTVCVGKAGGGRSALQSRINRMMAGAAREGLTVVRLKGGDPMLFGRGAEEASFLARRGVSCEIVPGVSAAIAVPSRAGIPLTRRGVSSSVTILTGHEAALPRGGVDWARLLAADSTFVVLMGVERLGEIVARFLAAGKDPGLPAALVESGCTPRERTVRAPLGRIAAVARDRGIAPPAMLVVGRAASRRMALPRRPPLPLRGAAVLVARPAGQAAGLARLLEERGATPILCPLIEIRPPRGTAALDRRLRALSRYDWVVFTSANGVRACLGRLYLAGRDARAFSGVRICAIGAATAVELSRHGLRVECIPSSYTTAGIARELSARGEVEGRSFLLPGSDRSGEGLPAALRRMGGRCDAVCAYRTAHAAAGIASAARALRRGEIDAVLLTSPSAAEAYARAVARSRAAKARLPIVVAIGPVTEKASEGLGLAVAAAGSPHTDEGLVRALERCWKKGGTAGAKARA